MISGERELLDAMEEKIDVACRASLCALRYRRNQLSILNRLPDELLLMIFLLSEAKDAHWNMFQYIHLTWICRRWRILALGRAEFWTNINLTYHKAEVVEEFMSRSKGAKLSVALYGELYYAPKNEVKHHQLLKALIGPQFGRVESLDLNICSDTWEQIIPILQQPAPFLRHCQLTCDAGYSSYFANPNNASVTLPADLFKGTTQLRILELCNVAPPWTSIDSMIHGLRQLKLTMSLDSPITRPTREQLLRILEACPNLEMLCLKISPPSLSSDSAPAVSPSITMPRLSNIRLLSSADACILGYISTPVLKRLYLKIGAGTPTMLADWVAGCFDLTVLQMVAIGTSKIYNRGSFFFQGWHSTEVPVSVLGGYVSDDEDKDGDYAQLSLHIDCFPVDLDALRLLWPALIAPTTNVSTLALQSIEAPGETYLDLLKQTVKQADNVKDLIISHQRDAQSLFDVLADPSVCPELRSLTYEGAPYERSAPGKQLVSLVKARRKGPVNIKTIHLIGCPPLAKGWAGQLERSGVDVQASEILVRVRSSPTVLPPVL